MNLWNYSDRILIDENLADERRRQVAIKSMFYEMERERGLPKKNHESDGIHNSQNCFSKLKHSFIEKLKQTYIL